METKTIEAFEIKGAEGEGFRFESLGNGEVRVSAMTAPLDYLIIGLDELNELRAFLTRVDELAGE